MSLKTSSLLFSSTLGKFRTFNAILSGMGLAACLCVALCPAAFAQTAHFSGSYFFVQNDATALSGPQGVAVDGSGNVFVADTGNNRVVEETPSASGYTQTVVATSTLSGPFGVATDASGNLYIADTGHDRVLKEVPSVSGGTTTWAETTVANYAGDLLLLPTSVAVDSNNVVYIAGYGNNAALKMTPQAGGGYSEAVLSPGLTSLFGIAVDSSLNLYYTDYSAGKAYVSVWSGTGYGAALLLQSGLSSPGAISVDGAGNVYIADSGHDQIWKDSFEGSSYSGSQLVFPLNNPLGVAVDSSGNVFIASTSSNWILESTGGNFGSVPIGATSPMMVLNFTFDTGGALFYNPIPSDFTSSASTCVESGSVFLAPTHLYSAGDYCAIGMTFKPTMAGVRYGAFDLTGYIQEPDGDVWTLATGPVYGFGTGPQVSFPSGTQTDIAIGSGHQPGPIALDPAGNILFIDLSAYYQNLESLSQTISSAPVNITPPDEGKPGFIWAMMQQPHTVAADAGFNLYEYDGNSIVDGVLKWTQNWNDPGGFATNGAALFGSSVSSNFPMVAVDGSGNLYITDSANSQVVKETLVGGNYIQTIVAAGLGTPEAVAVDGFGNVYISNFDGSDWEIYKETLSNGTYSQSTISQSQSSAFGIAVDAGGNIYISDQNENEVLKQTWTAGSYVQSQVPVSNLGQTAGVAVDGSGNLYVSDRTHSQIVKLDYADPPSLSFANTAIGATSGSQTVTVQNNGTSTLMFSAVSYPAGFPEASSAASECTSSTSLTPGETCTVTVAFEPTAVPAPSGQVVLTNNALNGAATQQQIDVAGTAIQGAQTISFTQPASPVFYPSSSIGLLATGGASGNPVTFGIVSGPGSLNGTNNSVLTVTGAGTVVVAANQAANTNYAAATEVRRSIVVNQLATISSPTPGNTIGSGAVFLWTTGTGPTAYELMVGTTGIGSRDLLSTGSITATTATVPTVPTNGLTVYVRLYQKVNAVWQFLDYTYQETGAPVPAEMSMPTPGNTIASGAAFIWTAGTGPTAYELMVGTTGAGSRDLLSTGSITATTATVPTVPTNGLTVYVRLYQKINAVWQFHDYTYLESGAPVPAKMLTPTPGNAIASGAAFTWTTGTGPTAYELMVGTTGVGSRDLLSTGSIPGTTATVPFVPNNGQQVYVRLYQKIDGAWQFHDYTYIGSVI